VPDASGREVTGVLEDAVVMETAKKVHGIYRLNNGKQIIATCPLFDKEFEVFKQHPDTFFGVHKKHRNEARDPVELFDFFHGVYCNTPKEKLLKFMEGHHDYQQLKNKSQEELAFNYCERLVYSAMKPKEQRPPK